MSDVFPLPRAPSIMRTRCDLKGSGAAHGVSACGDRLWEDASDHICSSAPQIAGTSSPCPAVHSLTGKGREFLGSTGRDMEEEYLTARPRGCAIASVTQITNEVVWGRLLTSYVRCHGPLSRTGFRGPRARDVCGQAKAGGRSRGPRAARGRRSGSPHGVTLRRVRRTDWVRHSLRQRSSSDAVGTSRGVAGAHYACVVPRRRAVRLTAGLRADLR